MRFVIEKANNNQYYFKIKADNGKILCHSETYVNKSDARHTVDLIKENAEDAVVVDMTNY